MQSVRVQEAFMWSARDKKHACAIHSKEVEWWTGFSSQDRKDIQEAKH